jgi:drug/metabolite transporter (DMT)-like permease
MTRKGIIFSLLTALVSGISVYVNSIFIAKIDPILFAFVRNFLVAIILSILIFPKISEIKSLSKHNWINLIIIGIIGGGVPFALFFIGLSKIGAINGAIIHKSMFLWVALLAIPFLSESVSGLQLFGYGFLFAATYFIGGTFAIVPKIGTLFVLSATLLWAIEQIVAKKTLKSISPDVVSWGRMVFGLPFLGLITLIYGKFSAIPGVIITGYIPLIVSSGFLVIYMATWYRALKKAPATVVSAVLVSAPVVTIMLDSISRGKIPGNIQIWQSVFFLSGVVLMLLPHKAKIKLTPEVREKSSE